MKNFLLAILLIVAILLLLPIALPSKINVETQQEFNVPIGIVFEEFNNLKEFSEWEPWSKLDTATKKEYFAPYRGVGASYQWSSENEDVGKGILTIKNADSNKSIKYHLIIEGWEEPSTVEVNFEALTESKTKVTWKMESGKMPYLLKYYTFFMKGEILKMYNQGFTNLKNKLAKRVLNTEQSNALIPGMIELEEFKGEKLVVIPNETSLDKEEINTAIEETLGKIYSYLLDVKKLDIKTIGKPTIYFLGKNITDETLTFSVGYPIQESVELADDMQIITIPSGTKIVSIHKGDPATLETTLEKMKAYAKAKNLKTDFSYFIEYLKDKSETELEDLQTKIYLPVE